MTAYRLATPRCAPTSLTSLGTSTRRACACPAAGSIRSVLRSANWMTPRYAAMAEYFDGCDVRQGHERSRDRPGRVMMCSTAATQVCLDVGATTEHARQRWQLAHALGPVLAASFANSPLRRGRETGWRSTRQAVWADVDPSRTLPPGDGDPVEAWSRYALEAPVMALRRKAAPWLAGPGMTFREWLHAGGSSGHPSHDDFVHHLSTLFPPVRPRGCLELRMVDAQPPAYWPVPLAVATALLDDPAAADAARAATEPVRDRWLRAARDALQDPPLARSARACFAAVQEALPRLGADASLTALVAQYADRYVCRGRCPADDVLDDRHAAAPSALDVVPETVP